MLFTLYDCESVRMESVVYVAVYVYDPSHFVMPLSYLRLGFEKCNNMRKRLCQKTGSNLLIWSVHSNSYSNPILLKRLKKGFKK